MVSPFDALGLAASATLTDAEVRAAWRDIAAATHPDQDGGGDPAGYAAATGAYLQLRTAWGRSEALADVAELVIPVPEPASRSGGTAGTAWHTIARLPARVRHGRPGRLAVRSLAAASAALLAATVIGGTPSAPAVVVGCALWWALTARGDLAPPPGR